MDHSQDLVSVYLAANSVEAYLVKNLLADAGIEAQVSEENEPFAALGVTPPDVLVRRQDETQARALIAEYEQQQVARAERPEWRCPSCRETNPGSLDECDNCGTPRPDMAGG